MYTARCEVLLYFALSSHLQGYNGSQLWDTSFAAQALCDAGLGSDEVVDKVLRKAHSYVEQSQVCVMLVFMVGMPSKLLRIGSKVGRAGQ